MNCLLIGTLINLSRCNQNETQNLKKGRNNSFQGISILVHVHVYYIYKIKLY